MFKQVSRQLRGAVLELAVVLILGGCLMVFLEMSAMHTEFRPTVVAAIKSMMWAATGAFFWHQILFREEEESDRNG